MRAVPRENERRATMSTQTALAARRPESLARSDQRRTVLPACDIYENNEEVVVIADVPSVTPDALSVDLDNGELTISARRDASVEDGSIISAEYPACDFRRRFAAPGGIDASKINADLKHG